MLLFFCFFFSDQHLGTRGDTLFNDGGITDAARPETMREAKSTEIIWKEKTGIAAV